MSDVAAVAAALRDNDRFLLVDAREPGRRRARLDPRHEARPGRARQGLGHVPGRRHGRADRVRVPAARRAGPRAARRRGRRACSSRSTARTRSGWERPRRCSTRCSSRSTSTTTTTTPSSRRSTSSFPARRRPARSSATSSASSEVELTPEIAEALYVALVTDTGRFQYTNTTPKALRLAAELVEAGVDVHRVFQGIYESVEFAKLKLLARALERAEIYDGGRLVISHLLRTDFTELGVGEEYAEGIIDYLRAVDGTDMAAVIREPPEPPDAKRRVSLRASHDELDVSAIARARGGGGPPPGGRLLERRVGRGDRGVHPGGVRSCLRARLGRPASCSSTSRRGRRRSPSSSGSATARERGRAMRERSTRSRPGSCSCCSARRRGSRSTSSGSTSAT